MIDIWAVILIGLICYFAGISTVFYLLLQNSKEYFLIFNRGNMTRVEMDKIIEIKNPPQAVSE